MKYYRCRCGETESWGSMPPNPCTACKKCGSDLATHPDDHREPLAHDFSLVKTIQTDQGEATITRCRYCLRTRAQIESREMPL